MTTMTIKEWCAKHRFSRNLFYALQRAGKAPRTIHAGRTVRISEQADADWVRERERESMVAPTSGDAAEAA